MSNLVQFPPETIMIIKKKNFDRFCKIDHFLFSKPKVVYLRSFLFFLPFPKFQKQLMHFAQNNVETQNQ